MIRSPDHSLLPRLLSSRTLSARDTSLFLDSLLSGQMSEASAKAILLLMAVRGETAEEILGAVRSIRRFEGTRPAFAKALMDNCGTGGDNSGSFNISTTAAFVIAGAGGKVVKHGNRSISSRCGSSDLMEALGVRIDAPAKIMIQAVRRYGIGYFHAPFYHPAFKKIQPLRRKLGVRTLFNLIGPFLNPFELEAQVMGVADTAKLPVFAQVMAGLKRKRALLVASEDGMDELSSRARARIYDIRGSRRRAAVLDPAKLGCASEKAGSSLRGGSASMNRKILERILSGREKGPKRDVVILNAAAGLVTSGICPDWKTAVSEAGRSIDSGAARRALAGLIQLTRGETK